MTETQLQNKRNSERFTYYPFWILSSIWFQIRETLCLHGLPENECNCCGNKHIDDLKK
jgi:hypothetical protein